MKLFKKITLITIAILLLATLNVYAGVTEVVGVASSQQVKVGETVTITLTAKCGTGLEGIDSKLKYDKTKLKLTNQTKLANDDFISMSDVNDLTGEFSLSILYGGSGNAPQVADYATLQFEVLSTAQPGETLTVQLVDTSIGDSKDEWTNVADTTVTFKVAEQTQQPADPEDPTDPVDPTDPTDPADPEDPSKPSDSNGNGENNGNDGNNNPNSTNGNKNDNTTSKNEIPKAGLSSTLVVGIVAIVVVAVVMYRKNKKYQDII